MTTTPDSRIRADWNPDGTPYDTADRHLGPMTRIDTSTTAGKIAVMEHVATGGQMQMTTRGRGDSFDDDGWSRPWCPPGNYNFNWKRYDYRIAPPPAPSSALQNARDVIRHRPAAHNPDSLAMMALVSEIDIAPEVWFGEALLDQCGITGAAPGRYRLLRDEE